MPREDIISQAAEQASEPMRPSGEHRNDLAAGYAILRERRIIRVSDFEEELKKRLHPTEQEQTTTLKGKKRTVWENRTDWVKANLTKRDVIRYFQANSDRWILFAEGCGHIDGTKLIPLRTLHDLITQFGHITGVRFTT